MAEGRHVHTGNCLNLAGDLACDHAKPGELVPPVMRARAAERIAALAGLRHGLCDARGAPCAKCQGLGRGKPRGLGGTRREPCKGCKGAGIRLVSGQGLRCLHKRGHEGAHSFMVEPS